MSPEQAPTETSPASNEPVSSDDLVGLFKAELEAESAPAPKQPEAPVEAASEEPSAPPAEEPQETEQAETSEQESSTPAIQPPRGMSEADKALFEQLPPEAKAYLARREKETQADYTRKTQEAAEVRKAVEAAGQQVVAKLQQYDQILSQFTAQAPVPPDPALRQTDPLGYEDALAQYVHAKHLHETATAEQSRVRAEYQQHIQAQQQHFWAEENKRLAEMAPELAAATPEAAKTRKAVFDYGLQAGFTKQQLDNASARDLVTLWKAQRYDAAMSKKPAVPVQPTAPKVMQPGPAKAAGRNNGFASVVRNLTDNPSRASLAEAYRAELAAER